MPSVFVATTGTPADSASSAATARPSHVDVNTTTCDRAISGRASSTPPVKRVTAAMPRSRARASVAACRGPSPTTRKRTRSSTAAISAAMSMKRSGRFCSTRRPTRQTTGAPSRPSWRSSAAIRATETGSAGGTALKMTLDAVGGHARGQQPFALRLGDADDVIHPREDAHGHRHVGLGDRLKRGEDRRRAAGRDDPARHERDPRHPRAVGVDERGLELAQEPCHGHDAEGRAARRASAVGDAIADDGLGHLGVEEPRLGGERHLHAVGDQALRQHQRDALGPAGAPACDGLQDPHAAAARRRCIASVRRLGRSARPASRSRKRAASIPLPTSVRRSSASPSPPRLRPARQVTAPR